MKYHKIISIFLIICICLITVPIEAVGPPVNSTEKIEEINSLNELNSEIKAENSNLSDNKFSTKRLIVKSQESNFDSKNAANIFKYNDIFILTYNTEKETENAYNLLQENKDIVSVEVDSVLEIENDDDNTISTNSKEESKLKEYIQSKEATIEVKIAILDTGINKELLDSGKIINSNLNLSTTGDKNSILDDNGHGTEIANIINNNSNDKIKIMPIKIANSEGKATIIDTYIAIEKAIEEKVDIINISMSTKSNNNSYLLEEAIKNATNNNIKVIVSAGNNNSDVKDFVPGNIDSAIVVGAVNNNNNVSDYSNYGKTVDYYSYGQYTNKTGTSYATANISTIYGLLLSTGENPEEIIEQHKTEIIDNYSEQKKLIYLDKLLDNTNVETSKKPENNLEENEDELQTAASNIYLTYSTHLSGIGWTPYSSENNWNGLPTSSATNSNRIEAIKINLANNSGISGSIKYRVHLTSSCWVGGECGIDPNNTFGGWCGLYNGGSNAASQWITISDGIAGSTGFGKHMEAVELKLTGNLSNYYYINYYVHTYYKTVGGLDTSKINNRDIGCIDKTTIMNEVPGWNPGGAHDIGTSNFAGTYMCSLPITGFKATIKERIINLKINPNGGSYENNSSETSTNIAANKTKSITAPVRTGYTFTGWTVSHSSASGSADNGYQPVNNDIAGSLSNNIYTSGNMNATLTANWKVNTYNQTVNVRYQNADGSWGGYTPVINTDYNYGSTVSWSRAADATYKAANIANYTVTGSKTTNVDVYRNTHTVTVNKGTGISAVLGGGTYYYGQSCTINATLTTGYNWINWTGSSTLANQSNTITITGDVSYTANARISTHIQTINVRYQNENGDWGNYSTVLNTSYNYGSTVSWSRAADATYKAASITSYTVTGAKTTNVDVYRNTHTVTLNKGTGISAVSGAKDYYYGQSCTINATLLPGYRWSNWTGSSTLTPQSNTFTVTGNVTYTANALINSSTLKVDPNAGSWNSSTSSQNFTQNYNTTKAIPIPTRTGYTFTGWTRTNSYGAMSSLTAAATYTFGATHNVTDTITASWRINQYPVTYIDVVDSTTGTELSRTTKQVDYNSSVRGNTLGSSTADNAYHNAYYYVSDTQATVTTSGATVYRIFKLRTKDITVTKVWNDNSNIYSTRPGNLKINVLQNGNLLRTLTFSSSNAVSGNPDKWQQITTSLQKYDSSGKEYLYTIKEDENNANLQYFYEAPVYDQNNLTVTNRATYIPIKPNEKSIYKITLANEIINKNNQIATQSDFETLKININNTYNFYITMKELNRSVINTGTELKEVYSGYTGKEYSGIITNKEELIFNDIPAGKYEISEAINQYFTFENFTKMIGSSENVKLTTENGKYFIEISGLTGKSENIKIKVLNKIKSTISHIDIDNKINLFKK